MIEIKHLYKKYGQHTIFEDFNLNIMNGDFVIVTGKSGCGKTTLMNIISSLESADAGEIIVDGVDIRKKRNQLCYLRDHVGFLFQNYGLIENKTVRYNMRIIEKKARSGVTMEEALKSVDMDSKIDSFVYELSGGEQQRVALARLMYKKCSVIFADEPTGSLDKDNAIRVMKILSQLNREGKTILMVTHDLSLISFGTIIVDLMNHTVIRPKDAMNSIYDEANTEDIHKLSVTNNNLDQCSNN